MVSMSIYIYTVCLYAYTERERERLSKPTVLNIEILMQMRWSLVYSFIITQIIVVNNN